ncbi:hypothetical protein [Streptomyces vinaceus]|uniref:hypothetical protein n=1 Tax=Streptomyces vinaceus TaxID=1960 RepID=UPI0037FB44D8
MTSLALLGTLAVASPAAAADPLQHNCAVRAMPSVSYAQEMKCFTFFDQAVAYASGNTVDASAWRWDPRAAIYSPSFTRAVDTAPGDRRILSIEFEHADYRGYALVVWGTGGNCEPGRERVVKNLGQTTDHWWTDKVSSFSPYNGCYSEHFDDINLNRLLDGQNYKMDMTKGNDRTNALSLHGGLSAKEADDDCNSGKAKCTFTPDAKIEYVPTSIKDEMLGWNCSTQPQQIRFDDNITRTSSYTFEMGLSTSYGVEAGIGDTKSHVDTTLSLTFGASFGEQLAKDYDATQVIEPGSVGIISSAVANRKISGTWSVTYPKRKWYHTDWHPSMTAHRLDPDQPMHIVYNQRPMSSAEKASFCSRSSIGVSEPAGGARG